MEFIVASLILSVSTFLLKPERKSFVQHIWTNIWIKFPEVANSTINMQKII